MLADFVIISVEIDRLDTWEQDRAVPERFGIRQALALNLSNPMSRILQAVRDHTRVRTIGLCHEIAAVVADREEHYDAFNLPNAGYIENLPPDCIVEVPGRVTGDGFGGRTVAPLKELVSSSTRGATQCPSEHNGPRRRCRSRSRRPPQEEFGHVLLREPGKGVIFRLVRHRDM